MKVNIENNVSKRMFWFNIDKAINNLLNVIPKEHLVGLEKIIVVDDIKLKKKKKAAGSYRAKIGWDPAVIELSIKSIYKGMPKILFLFPFVAKFSIASVLFHEIGHHHHHKFKHGIGRSKKETFAEDYSKTMLKKAFWGWKIILRPISPLIRWLAKVVSAHPRH